MIFLNKKKVPILHAHKGNEPHIKLSNRNVERMLASMFGHVVPLEERLRSQDKPEYAEHKQLRKVAKDVSDISDDTYRMLDQVELLITHLGLEYVREEVDGRISTFLRKIKK